MQPLKQCPSYILLCFGLLAESHALQCVERRSSFDGQCMRCSTRKKVLVLTLALQSVTISHHHLLLLPLCGSGNALNRYNAKWGNQLKLHLYLKQPEGHFRPGKALHCLLYAFAWDAVVVVCSQPTVNDAKYTVYLNRYGQTPRTAFHARTIILKLPGVRKVRALVASSHGAREWCFDEITWLTELMASKQGQRVRNSR